MIEKLSDVVYRKGFKYILKHRTDNAAIYAQYIVEDLSVPISFEVFRIVITPESILPNGIIIPTHETFPSNSVFGRWAWTYKTFEDAMERFNKIEAKIEDKERSKK